MGLKSNDTIIILFIGLGATCILAAVCMFRIWGFYILKTKNKAIHLRNIRRKRNAATIPKAIPLQKDPEGGETV